MIKVEIGQPVIMTGNRPGGEPGTVVKIGRVWIEVRPNGIPGDWTYRFRLDDQTDGSGYTGRARFYTLDQWAKKLRHDEAATFLREQGIEVGFGSSWRGRKAELADIIRAHLEPPAPEGPLGGAIDGPTDEPTADRT